MALHLNVPNGNPWPKSWGIQVPILNNNVPNVPPSKFQKSVKLAYNRDVRSFQKYYNKNVAEVICSGIPLPRSMSARCKLVTKLELYEHSQVKSKFYNLRSLKLGGLPQKKSCVKFVKGLIHHNKSLKDVWIDRYETMKVLSYDLKFPRQLGSFSLGLFDCPKEQMSKKLQFLKRYRNLKQIALCSTEPQQPQPRAIDVEAQSFLTFLESTFKKNNLKGIKLDLMDPKVAERSNLLNDFLLKKISQNDLESFDLRLTLTQVPQLDETAKKILEQLDYFALSLDGASFQSRNSIWAEESIHNQQNRQRSFMVNFKGLTEIDLNPILASISPSLKALDLSFNNDQCSFGVNWFDIMSRFESLESLSLSFTNCSGVLGFCLAALSSCATSLCSLKSIAVKIQNINFTPELYDAIDQFYSAIQHVPRHTFSLEAPSAKDIQLDTLCASLHRLNNLKTLKLMMHLGTVDSVQCIGDLIKSQEDLERLDLHVRLEMYNSMPFNLPLEKLAKLEYLRIELLFRPESQFVSQLNSSIARLEALQHLELNILCYSKISYSVFQSLLARLNLIRGLKELEMSVNVEDESVNETLPQKNMKLKKELQSLLSHHPSLTKIMFHQFVSIICCTRYFNRKVSQNPCHLLIHIDDYSTNCLFVGG